MHYNEKGNTFWITDQHLCSVSYVSIKNFVPYSPQSELYRPSDRRLSTKLVPNLLIEGVAWSAQPIPTAVNLRFLDRIYFNCTY
jgi:hypothetical protein